MRMRIYNAPDDSMLLPMVLTVAGGSIETRHHSATPEATYWRPLT